MKTFKQKAGLVLAVSLLFGLTACATPAEEALHPTAPAPSATASQGPLLPVVPELPTPSEPPVVFVDEEAEEMNTFPVLQEYLSPYVDIGSLEDVNWNSLRFIPSVLIEGSTELSPEQWFFVMDQEGLTEFHDLLLASDSWTEGITDSEDPENGYFYGLLGDDLQISTSSSSANMTNVNIMKLDNTETEEEPTT